MLPKIQTPIFRLTLPSNGKEIKFRPFTVKEEKILLIAKESGEAKDVINAFKQIATNCILDTNLNVEMLPIFDLEYVFLMIRAKSANNISRVNIKDDDDGEEYDAIIDIDAVEIVQQKDHSKTIDLDGNVGVVMRYPNLNDLQKFGAFDGGEMSETVMMEIVNQCIEQVYDAENVYPMNEASQEERTEFFESLNKSFLTKIQTFFQTFPYVVAKAIYKTKDGKEKTKEIRGAANFLS